MCWRFSFDQNWRFSPDPEWLNSPDSNSIGGYLPIVVMKKDGSFIPMTQYVLTHKSQKELRKFKI